MSFIFIFLRRHGQAVSPYAEFSAQGLSGAAKKSCVLGRKKAPIRLLFCFGVLPRRQMSKSPRPDVLGRQSLAA